MWSGTLTTPSGSGSVLIFAHGNQWLIAAQSLGEVVELFFDDIENQPTGAAFVEPLRPGVLSSGQTIDFADFTSSTVGAEQRTVTIDFDDVGRYAGSFAFDATRTNIDGSIEALQGGYVGSGSDGSSLFLGVDASGRVTGTDQQQCSYDLQLYNFSEANIYEIVGGHLCNGAETTVLGSASRQSENVLTLLLDMSDGYVLATMSR